MPSHHVRATLTRRCLSPCRNINGRQAQLEAVALHCCRWVADGDLPCVHSLRQPSGERDRPADVIDTDDLIDLTAGAA